MAVMKTLLHLACLVMAVASGASDLSETFQQYYCTYNGVYNNHEYIQNNPDSGIVPVEVRVQSLYIPGLSDLPCTYMEQADNGTIVLAEIGINSEEANKGVRADPYNFTDYSSKKPGEININDYKNLTKDKLQENQGCSGLLTQNKDYEFYGQLPDCRHANKFGVHRDYSARVLCDVIYITVPLGAAEGAAGADYALKRTGDKYPMPDPSIPCNCGSDGS